MDQMNDSARHSEVIAAYAAHADDVYRLAYAILRDQDDAVDATQDVFVRAFERWDRYDPQ
nr:RNA polymerase subunit sigma-70 [Chloroflexota bacterium]